MKKILAKLSIFLGYLIFGIVLTHYLEPIELPWMMKVRNVLYFGKLSHHSSESNTANIQYKEIDSCVFNPVTHVQTVWSDVRKVLGQHIDSSYYLHGVQPIDDGEIDTAAVIKFANSLLYTAERKIINGQTFHSYKYQFPWHLYNLEPGWVSGMAQGHATELYISAYYLSKDSSYLSAAKAAIKVLEIPTSSGGAQAIFNEKVWFEEYASINNRPPLVLNGHIFAIDGLYALSKTIHNDTCDDLLKQAILAVNDNIDEFRITRWWSAYDQWTPQNIASHSYHHIHVKQLEKLAELGHSLNIDNHKIIRAHRDFLIGLWIPVGVFVRLYYMHNRMLLLLVLFNTVLVSLLCIVIVSVVKRKRHIKDLDQCLSRPKLYSDEKTTHGHILNHT